MNDDYEEKSRWEIEEERDLRDTRIAIVIFGCVCFLVGVIVGALMW